MHPESQNPAKNSTNSFLFNGVPQGPFPGTFYPSGRQGILPPDADVTTVFLQREGEKPVNNGGL